MSSALIAFALFAIVWLLWDFVREMQDVERKREERAALRRQMLEAVKDEEVKREDR